MVTVKTCQAPHVGRPAREAPVSGLRRCVSAGLLDLYSTDRPPTSLTSAPAAPTGVTVPLAAATRRRPPRMESFYFMGMWEHHQHRDAAALAAFAEGLALADTHLADIDILRGRAFCVEGNILAARDCCHQAWKKTPEAPPVYRFWAELSLFWRRFSQTINLLEPIWEENKRDYAAALLLAKGYLGKNRLAEAEELLSIIIQEADAASFNGYHEAWFLRGSLYAAQGRELKAIVDFSLLIERNYFVSLVKLTRAVTYEAMELYPFAKQDYADLLKENATHQAAQDGYRRMQGFLPPRLGSRYAPQG
jgi:tetratricopeptide (TPR) repeat protein